MPPTDTTLLSWRDLAEACQLLTRLPIPLQSSHEPLRGARAVWAYPLVAGIITAAGLGVGWTLAPLVGAPLAAMLALTVTIALSGALHEDGLADTCDGLWGGATRARRLEIMRDSRIGTFGVLGLTVTLILRWQALSWMLAGGAGPGWIAAAALGRAAMGGVMYALPHARADGLAAGVGRPGLATMGLGCGIGMFAAIVCLGSGALAIGAAGCALVAGCLVGWVAWRKIEGQTGDILGACAVVVETAVLLFLAAFTS